MGFESLITRFEAMSSRLWCFGEAQDWDYMWYEVRIW